MSEEKKGPDFQELIRKFNGIYRLPVSGRPSLPTIKRLENFKNILTEEVNEVDKIIEKYRGLNADAGMHSEDRILDKAFEREKEIELLTELSDWLGDMIVYITSEATKYGLNMDQTLKIIMQSNFSKLGHDGNPIYDERGKVMKGPNYWKPEPRIKEFLDGIDKN